MGRHTQAVCKLCRREGDKLYLKGEKCYTPKCPLSRRSYAPGVHGKAPVKLSEYALRLREKQQARRVYGLSERQFKNYFLKAAQRPGITGEILLQLLERRLDNVIYRLGFSSSRQEGRQLVRHGHILVNGRKVNIPSYEVKIGGLITVKPKAIDRIKKTLEKLGDRKPPAWLNLDTQTLEGKVAALPRRQEIDTLVEEHLIVEFYSR